MDNKIYSKVFLWLFIGLLITFGVGYGTQYLALNNENIANIIYSSVGFWVIIILDIVIAIFLSTRISKMSSTTAKILYIIYCMINGITFSAIFLTFKLSSIIFSYLMKFVRNLGSSSTVKPFSLPNCKQFKKNAILRANCLIVERPSSSCITSSGVFP